MSQPLLQQLDQVELLTTKNVRYLSAKPGVSPTPHGLWSVVGIVEGDILISKDGALVRIPVNDVKKAANYSLEKVLNQLRMVKNGEIQDIKDIKGDQAEEPRRT